MKKLFSTFVILSLTLLPLSPALAEFNPNLIMSDTEFVDYTSMTLDDVQRFLEDKNSTLATYVDPRVRMRASQIIWDNSQLTGINPKVLLVTLQKEQSLITDQTPVQGQYDAATGFGFCDGDCRKGDPKLAKYVGFANQIDYAASSFRLFFENPQRYGYHVGKTYIIDGEPVHIGNAATHALYIYTPHLHGNKNFHRIWKEWFSHDFPDGTLLQDADTGGIYIIQNGAKRPFASMLAFASRYDLGKVIVTSKENLDSFPLGPPIKYSQYALLQDKVSGGIYLIVDDHKRPIASRDAFRQIGFNPEEVEQVDPSDLATVPTGKPITVENAHPTGALYQDVETGGVWYVQDNARHAIWSRELMDINYPHLNITRATPAKIAQYTEGEPVKFADGELIKSAESPTVYVVSNGLKLPIPTEEVFLKLGYSWHNIITTTEKALSLHLTGEELSIENL